MMRSLVFLSLAFALCAQNPSGERIFRNRCAPCHGGNAEGGERGPSITAPVTLRTNADLSELIRNGLPGAGMPASPLNDADLQDLIAHLRTLVPRRLAAERIETPVRGIVRNKSDFDMQVQGDDHRIHLLRRDAPSAPWREIRGDRDWPTYHGSYTGNRHSPLAQIHKDNVQNLAAAWTYTIPNAQPRLQVTPVVLDGVMYVTNVNEVHAIDAGTGRRIWQYKRPRTKTVVIGDAASGINRGVAIHGDRLFTVTDHAHLIALNRITGALLWDVEMADHRENYGATAAPLVVGDLVISGTSGGDEGVRGFLAAYRVTTGERAWRFWTVPAPGEPGSETWQGTVLPHGCATTWLTGTYDPQLDLLYWTTGNPCPDYNGDQRRGDNLYSDSVLALRPRTGELVWYFQYTPHDLHDWDSVQPPVLIDWKSQKLLAQANRNGFFYVLDRATGKFLHGSPFVKQLTWARGLDDKGRPLVIPESAPAAAGTITCPAVEGATNWFSTAFHPDTGLFYLQALEKCNTYRKSPGKWEAGKSYYDGETRDIPGEPGAKYLRALDIDSGRIVWERKQTGPANSWGGVLSTDGGLVFAAEDSGYFIAVDARSGDLKWRFATNTLWKASPMTYSLDGRQYIAIASGNNILAFALPAEQQAAAQQIVRESIEWLDVWIPNTNDRGLPRVLLIGDSITRGYGKQVEAGLKDKAWVARLATSKSLGDPALLDQIALVLREHRFDVIHCNNGMHGDGYSEQAYAAALPQLLATLRREAPRARIILASTTDVRERNNLDRVAPKTARMIARNAAVADFARRESLPFNDLYAVISDHPEYHAADGVHFNEQGSAALAAQVVRAIAALLAQ